VGTVKLTLRAGRYIALSEYAEKDIPKNAGFRWDRDARVWYTTDTQVASKLVRYADESCRQALSAAGEKREAALAASRATDARDIEIPAPEGLAYLPFQRAGIAYAQARPATLIGDEMGLGKTIQAIGLVNADPSIKRVLCVVPASLKINWSRELAKWLTRPLTVGIANGAALPTTDVVVVNYEILVKHSAALHAVEWDLVIVDEAHRCKSPEAQRTEQLFGTDEYRAKKLREDGKASKIVEPIAARRKLLLTGTPIANRPRELFPLLHYLHPRAWPSFFAFARRYCGAAEGRYGWDFDGASHLDELQEKLRLSVMVRRLKADVLTELPAKRRSVVELPANGCAGAIKAEHTAWDRNESAIAEAQARVELAKASDDPADYESAVAHLREAAQAAFTEMSAVRHETAVSKVPAVVEHLTDALESVDKVVVFCHHRDVEDAIMAALAEAKIPAVLHRGGLSDDAKQAAVDAFQANETVRVFVGSIQASGVGITLTASSHVLFAELDWVPGNVTQAEDRCHRIGQTDTVFVQHLVLDGSLDARMAHILVAKQQIIDKALDRMAAAVPAAPTREQAATADTPRSRIEKLAETLTDSQRTAAHLAVRLLAGLDPDGAREINEMGFNRLDGRIGHELAERATLSPRQAALAWTLVQKYHRQLQHGLMAVLKGEAVPEPPAAPVKSEPEKNKLDITLHEDDYEKYGKHLKLTYLFDNMPANQSYSKYKKSLRNACRITLLGNLEEGLNLFNSLKDQKLPNEYKEMIDKNIRDVKYYLRGKFRSAEADLD